MYNNEFTKCFNSAPLYVRILNCVWLAITCLLPGENTKEKSLTDNKKTSKKLYSQNIISSQNLNTYNESEGDTTTCDFELDEEGKLLTFSFVYEEKTLSGKVQSDLFYRSENT